VDPTLKSIERCFLSYAHSFTGLLTASPHVGEAVCIVNGCFNFTAVDLLTNNAVDKATKIFSE
jgi:hypothetical protein